MIDHAAEPRSTVEGHLERIAFFNPENHYTVAHLIPLQSQQPITIVGYMTGVRPGQALRISGTWETHSRYGQQLKIQSYSVVLPDSAAAIRQYLESGIIKGIGPVTARRLVDRFGADTLRVIEEHPQQLCEIEGIGSAKAETIAAAWQHHHGDRRLSQFLQTIGLKNSFCAKLLKAFGSQAVDVISENPYRLVEVIPGISFFAADEIAQKLGMAKTEPQRIQACVRHIVQQSINAGHMFIFENRLFARCLDFFGIPAASAETAVAALSDAQELVVEPAAGETTDRAVYPKALHLAETGLAARLKALLTVPAPPVDIDAEDILKAVQKKLAIKLSAEQLKALEDILSHRAVVITGGPGTGKTTLIRSVNAVFEALARQVLLAAPTGRAARRLSEVTRREARTIHKLLGYNFETGHFDKHPDNPLDADVLIVDEASMVDTRLMFHLIRALPMTAHLVLVGDVFQLPPVGPGNVLSDIIASSKLPVYYLNTIFRQAQESPIIVNAHKVRQGNLPAVEPIRNTAAVSEFCFLEANHPEKIVAGIVELCSRVIPERFFLNPVNDIQVLSPMHKGVAGIINLNQVLQNSLNPNREGIAGAGVALRRGDKVIHLKNNYQKDVFNGDIGIICEIDKKNHFLSVDYDGRIVPYDNSDMDEITLAYAISVHKSQGSEYPAVIVPMTPQHFPLLQRNLLYTAMTRGQQLVILIGTSRALEMALQNDTPRKRLSRLAQRLTDE